MENILISIFSGILSYMLLEKNQNNSLFIKNEDKDLTDKSNNIKTVNLDYKQ